MAAHDMVTVVPMGTSPGPHVSGPTWASPGPGPESASPGEADMMTLVPSGCHLDQVNLDPSTPQLELVTLVLNLASLGPSEYAPHLRLIWTW